MKESRLRPIAIILGILVFFVAVYFMLAISLPLLGLDGQRFLLKIGNSIFATYKFSSFLIPVGLLYAAILLIIPGWSTRSKYILLTTPLFFLTCVMSEHLIYFLIPKINNDHLQELVKIAIMLCAGLMLILELFLSLILADKRRIIKFNELKGELNPDIIGEGYQIEYKEETQNEVGNELAKNKVNTVETNNSSENISPTNGTSLLSSMAIIENDSQNPIKNYNETTNLNEAEEWVSDSESFEPTALDNELEAVLTDIETRDDETLEELVPENMDEDLEEDANTDNTTSNQTDNKESLEDIINEYYIDDEVSTDDEADDDEAENENIEEDDDDDDEQYDEDDDSTIEITAAQPLEPKKAEKTKGYFIPYELLTEYPGNDYWIIDDATRDAAHALKNTFEEFNINIEITGIRKGPVVTMFEVLPPPGVKLGKITTLQDNIALRLAAQSVRIVAPIPGKQAVGIEVPNKSRAIVGFRELIQTEIPETRKMQIPIMLGKDVTGEPQTLDLCQTPHLLIAGATGSGKSVCVNSIILSILYNKSPQEVKLLLVDPKIVELKLYNGIGHLLTPVITDAKKALQGLQYCICEMERRYAMLDGMSVRDIRSYNKKIKRERIATEPIPYIVIIIDEFADLMATTGKELEATVARLCAMSRAVGIHLVLATQRPSTNVITGLIKANIPSRIAFMVASRVDSQIILDNNGAEKLLGRGDMLYVSTTTPFPSRIQGTFVSDEEVEQVVEKVKTYGEPDYIDDEIFTDDEEYSQGNLFGDEQDPLYEEALEIVLAEGKASASYIQRKLKIGYNRAARIVEEMEERGVVGPANGPKPREVIYTH